MLQNISHHVEDLGIKYPIIQAPMAGGPTTPELVAAVSNAGGLGSLGAGYMAPDDIRNAIKHIRELTNKPFAVNLFIPEAHQATLEQMQKACHDIEECSWELGLKCEPMTQPFSPEFEEQIQVVFEEQMPIFSFTFGILDSIWIDRLKSNNTQLIGTATSLAEVNALERCGIDMVVLQGSEAGGHRGTFLGEADDALIGLPSLVKQSVDQINIPVIAAGGIMNGQGIAAAISLGAVAAQMGTAFLTCKESGLNPHCKTLILAQQKDDTLLTRAFSGKLARAIQNTFIHRMRDKSDNILDFPIQNALTKAMRQKAKEKNATEFMSIWVGQSASLCRELNAKELIEQLVCEVGASVSDVD